MLIWFQSSFELTGYITFKIDVRVFKKYKFVSKLFRAYGLYNQSDTDCPEVDTIKFQSSFELTGYITSMLQEIIGSLIWSFKALSSLRVI